MPRCTVTVQSITITENGDGASAEWRLNVWVNGEQRSWHQDGVQDGVSYPLNWDFVIDIPSCSSPIRLRADGYEEDGGWFLDEHDPIAPLQADLNPSNDDPIPVAASNDDVSYTLTVRVDCPTCRVQPPQVVTLPDGSSALYDPNTGQIIPIRVTPAGPPPAGGAGGARLRELSLHEPLPIETHVVSREEFLRQVRDDFLRRLNERRAKELYRVPEKPTENDLLRVGLMRLAKSGWELTALNDKELILRLTPYGRARREYLRMVVMSLPES